MKKGLLTVLLASLVLVGCQNYDDQFDDLNAQISALKSQVDGLSSLSGQVSSLSGTISGLSAGVTAAQAAATSANAAASAIDLTGLSASLATLQAEVDAVQASLATAATASAVAALQTELDAIEADVDELLATSNVYTQNLTIGSASQLDAAVALGNNINIVNGNVDIDMSTAMDAVKMQSVLDKIFTVTGTWSYVAGSSAVTAMNFDKLASAGDMEVKQGGDYSFAKLVTAGTITLDDAYQSKVTAIKMPLLTTVTAFQTDSSTNVDEIEFATAVMNVDLGSLAYYTNAATNTLKIQTKVGATLDIASLDDKTSAGAAADYTLEFNGPASVNITNMESYEGAMTLTNVDTATVSDFHGLITVGDGVKTLTLTNAERVAGLDTASNLVTINVDIDKISDPDMTATAKAGAAYGAAVRSGNTPSFDPDSASLASVTLSGFWQGVTLNGHAALTTVDIDATMNDLDITNNDALTTLDVTGSEINDVTFTGNDAITAAVFDHTTELNYVGATTDDTNADVTITNNLAMTSLSWSADAVRKLQVTGNTAMTSMTMTGLATVGTSTVGPDVDIYSNSLTASAALDSDDGTTQYDGGTAAATNTDAAKDLGDYTHSTGMNTLATYLAAVYANTLSNAAVHFDTVTLYTIATGAAATGQTAGEQNSGNQTTFATAGEDTITAVVHIVPGSANTADGAKTAIGQIKGYIITPANVDAGVTAGTDLGTIQFTVNNVALFDTSLSGQGTALALNANPETDIAAIKTTINLSRATSAGVTMDAKRGANSTAAITIRDVIEGTSTAVIGERYTTATAITAANTATNYGMGADDYITVTVGSNSVTATGASATTLASAVYTAWAAKYHGSGTASAAAIATMTSPTIGNSSSQALAWTMNQEDSGGVGIAISAAVTAGTTTATSAAQVEWTIGASNITSNNTTVDDGLSTILTLTANDVLVAVPAVTTAVSAAGSMAAIQMSNTKTTNTAWANGSLTTGAQEPITDVRNLEAAVDAATSNAVARAVQWRVHWLS
jgi:hypothetical protein